MKVNNKYAPLNNNINSLVIGITIKLKIIANTKINGIKWKIEKAFG